MFLALLALDDFIAEAIRTCAPTVYIQGTMKSDNYGGIRTHLRSYVTLTSLGFAGLTSPVLTTRVHVETVATGGGDDREREQAISRRAEQAQQLIREHVQQRTGAVIANGILLQPGMLEEINKLDATHRLWGWDNGKDPIARELVPLVPLELGRA